MGYNTEQGRWANTDPVTFKDASSSPITASGDSGAIEAGDKGTCRVQAVISAVAGTNPTLAVALQTCNTKTGTYRTIGNFSSITAAGTKQECFVGCDRYIKLVWNIGGTSNPSFTGTISGELL